MTRYRIREDVKIAALAGEGVVLHLGSRRYYTANPTALFLLESLAAPRTRAELRAALMKQFDVAAEKADEGVDSFLGMCARADFVVPVEAGT